MKTQLLALTILIASLATGAPSKAEELSANELREIAIQHETDALHGQSGMGEGHLIINQNTSGQSGWVTIYNMFGDIRDSGCVKQNNVIEFGDYWGPLFYKVRVEMKERADCGGRTLFDDSVTFSGGGTTYIRGDSTHGFELIKGRD